MYDTSTTPTVSPTWIMVMHYYMAFQKVHKETTKGSKHMCQTCTTMLKVFMCNTSTHGPSLAPIEQCIHYKILTITYRAIQNRMPKYIMDLLRQDEPKRGNMQSNKSGLKLRVPLIKYNTFAARSFSYAAATLWNWLPTNIRECRTLDKFKSSLKTYLYRKAFKPAHTHN